MASLQEIVCSVLLAIIAMKDLFRTGQPVPLAPPAVFKPITQWLIPGVLWALIQTNKMAVLRRVQPVQLAITAPMAQLWPSLVLLAPTRPGVGLLTALSVFHAMRALPVER